MPFEKAKVLKAAEKFLSLGKINAAIKEYRQIIEHDADDLTALNMLGDLLARAGEKAEAVSCFSRIAEHYREQEFRLKAIAMYKKIEKLKPRDPETANKLADLYTAQGLIVDARAQYLVIADAYTRAGDIKQTLHVLHKIADLDPQNTDVRLKLAEGYLKESMQLEAARAYAEAANRLLEKGQFEESLDAYSKAFELRPHDKFVLKGLVSVHAALGTAEDAAEILEKAVADEPDDAQLIGMLAQAYIEAGDAPGAERATAQLMSQDASNYRRYIEVARAYLKAGEASEAARILGTIIEPMLAGREENDLVELVNELLDRDPEQVAGLRLLARIHWWQRDMEKLRSTLERLVESAEAADQAEDERYALTQLVRLAPDERRFADRLEALGGSLEESSEDLQFVDELASAEAPVYESLAVVEEAPDVTQAEVAEGVADEFEWNSVAEESLRDPNASFADLNEPEIESGFESEVSVLPDQVSPEAHAQEFVFDSADVDPATTEQIEPKADEHTDRVQSMMQQELESVDFYISQGYTDIAVDTLELLERQFGSHPDIASRREKLNPAGSDAQPLEQFESSSGLLIDNSDAQVGIDPGIEVTFADVEEPQPPASVSTTTSPTGIDSGLAEIFEEFRLEAEGENAASNEDYETHFNMATAYKEMDLLDEAIREFQTAAGLTKPADGTARYFQCCNMLGHCFVQKGMPRAAVLWFKKGLDAPGRAPEEYKALQYELGSAYEQMGDLQRAIGVFTEVYGLDVGYRDIAERLQELQGRQAAQKKKKGKQK
jgi:tetratricopeptide (TPR) repeat protein